MENKLTPELIAKAKLAKSAEELLALAKENGIELTEESANEYFADPDLKNGEISDEELDNVSGGCDPKVDCCDRCEHFVCRYCGSGLIYDETNGGRPHCKGRCIAAACASCKYGYHDDGRNTTRCSY